MENGITRARLPPLPCALQYRGMRSVTILAESLDVAQQGSHSSSIAAPFPVFLTSIARGLMDSETYYDQDLLERLRRKYSGARPTAAAQTTPLDGCDDDTGPTVKVCPTCHGSGMEKTEYHFRILEVCSGFLHMGGNEGRYHLEMQSTGAE